MFLPRKENIMVTDYDKQLTDYWKNWKPGMGPYKGNKSPETPKKQEVKVEVKVNDLADVMAHEVELLENKAVKNKERAEARKIAGDELRDTISNILSSVSFNACSISGCIYFSS